jgi:hypothetical protein
VLVSEAADGIKEQLVMRDTKKMTIREFNQEHKCNLLESIMNVGGENKRPPERL